MGAIRCTLEEERKDLGAAQREAQATEQKVLAMQEHTEYLEGLVREKNSLIEDLKSDLIKANEKVDTLEKEIKSGAALLPGGLTAAAVTACKPSSLKLPRSCSPRRRLLTATRSLSRSSRRPRPSLRRPSTSSRPSASCSRSRKAVIN